MFTHGSITGSELYVHGLLFGEVANFRLIHV